MSEEALLQLADLDRVLDRLRAARAGLVERTRVEEIERHLRALSAELSAVEAARVPRAGALRAASAESERLRARATQVGARLAQSVNAREAESLHEELDQVTHALETAEDAELTALVEMEPLDEAIVTMKSRAQPLIEERAELLETIRDLEETLDEETTARSFEREALATTLEPSLRQRYERALQRVGGAGAARLVEGRCAGCHVALAPADLDERRRAPEGEWTDCPSCGRILLG